MIDAQEGEAGALSDAAFKAIRELLYAASGIKLASGKRELVRSRVIRRLRDLGLRSFDVYVSRLASDPAEVARMVDVMTTNKTSFFREPPHFAFFAERLPAWRRAGRRLRVWSAGCSTGEEPYSIAMLLIEQLPDIAQWDARILGTDISERVLGVARAGDYSSSALAELDAKRRSRFFELSERGGLLLPEPRALVKLARLNLLGPWPMRGPFDVIFCRNVMIYFDEQTRMQLAQRYRELLAPGGLLFIGHSESLGPSPPGLSVIRPSIYTRAE